MLVCRILLLLGWTIALGTIASPAAAQAGFVGQAVPVCVTRAAPGIDDAAALAGRGVFTCGDHQVALGAGDFWARSGAMSVTGAVRIRIASLWQDRVTLYARYADGHVLRRTIDGHGASRDIQLGAIIEQPLAARAAPLVRLAWHVESAANLRGILAGARIARAADSDRSNLLMAALYAAFGGLAFALLVYNLALWAALRHRFQLAYCAMLAALLLYAFSSSGALAWVWPAIANNDRLRINYVSLAGASIAAMLFARSFFEARVFDRGLSRLITAVCTALGGIAITFALAAPWQIKLLDHLYSYAFAAQIAVVAPILWRGWRARSGYLWLFAFGWAAPIALAAVRVVSALHIVGWTFWIDNSTLATMGLEALLSSLAIAYRIKLLSRERDEAREQEIAARMLADVDPLTGLLNRRAFLDRAIGRGGEHTLLIADIDHFKKVNDTIGHDGGDEVLRLFARALRQSVPGDGLVARMGGEEFAILIGAARVIEGHEVLARLRATRMPFDLTVTASIGSCTGPIANDQDWKALYRGADRALFDAKAAGRDRFRRRANDRAVA